MIWYWLRNIVKSIQYLTKTRTGNLNNTPRISAEDINIPISQDSVLIEQQEEIKLLELKLQFLKAKNNQDLNLTEFSLSQAATNQLEDFIQITTNIRQQKNIADFYYWRLEQEKAIQLELLKLGQSVQSEYARYHRQASLKIVEEHKRINNSPIWLIISDILNSNSDNDLIPLRVFFAPPKLQFERFNLTDNSTKSFPDIEITLGEGLRQFFKTYSHQGRPIDFLAGAWVSKAFHSEASIKSLFNVLKSEPTLVLESEVDQNYLNFRLGYWSFNWSTYRYDSVISMLPYQDILYESAKARARQWSILKPQLISAGLTSEEANVVYGKDNIDNCQKLQLEDKLKSAGINPHDLEINYIVNKKDFATLNSLLIIYHCLFAGLVADEYFLVEYNLPPILPQLLPELLKPVSDKKIIQEMIQAVVLYYRNIYQHLEQQRSAWIPELALDLADILASFSNKSWAAEQIIYSVKHWLALRGLPPGKGFFHLLKTVESVINIEDDEYVEKLNKCLAAIGNNQRLSIMKACYQRGLNYRDQKKYEAAIYDFDQAIKLNSAWAEAYYNRGLAYAKLAQYQRAIADYTQALQLKPNWADAYNNRGNAAYKLGNYQSAIADYNQALNINPNFTIAAKNKHIAQSTVNKTQPPQSQAKSKEDNCQLSTTQLTLSKSKIIQQPVLQNCQLINTLPGHTNSVRCLAISPNGETLASGSYDKTIKLWNLNTGKELCTLIGHTNTVLFLAISADGQILASGSYDKTIKLWNLHTGKEIRTLLGHSTTVLSLAISPNGEILASGSYDNTIKLWNLTTGKELGTLTGHSNSVWSLAISPDGQILASGSDDNTIKLWNLATGREIRTLRGHSNTVLSLAISPDGETLASGSYDKTIKLWQLNTGKELQTLTGHSDSVWSLAIAPNGQILVSGSYDKTIKLWQLNTGMELSTLTGHSNSVWSVAISPDGRTLASGSYDKTIKLWQLF